MPVVSTIIISRSLAQVTNVLALSALAMVIFHPEMVRHVRMGSGSTDNGPQNLSGVYTAEQVPPPRVMPKYGPTYSVLGGHVWNVDDLNIGIMITFCTFVITLLMVVGAIKGQPSYLMPFFCLQVFDFCISRWVTGSGGFTVASPLALVCQIRL